jgi:hypothetical protein
MKTQIHGSVLLVVATLAAMQGIQGQPPQTPGKPALMDREKEIGLALSACPPFVAAKAAVYVLEESGYVKVRDSQNGFTAIVQHVTSDSQEPQCMDVEGARVFLPRVLKVAELRSQGKTPQEVQAFVSEAVKTGIFSTPARPGIIYMLSQHKISPGGKGEVYPPHVMFYGTHLTNADLGVDGKDLGPDGNPRGPAFVAGDGSPFGFIIVPVRTQTGSVVAQDKPSHNH